MTDKINIIKNIFAPAGYEGKLTDFIIEEIKPYGDECFKDKIGNVIFHKKGQGDKLLINVPVSSDGFFISHIEENGKAKVKAIGSINAKYAIGKRVRDINGNPSGVVMADKDDVKDEDDLYIDFGVYKKEDVKYSVGDILEIFDDAFIVEKNIYGCDLVRASNISAHLDIIKNLSTSFDLYYAFTIMDNIGFKGAKTAAFSINPDICITCGLSYSDIAETEIKLNNGPVVRIKDSHIIVNKKLRDIISLDKNGQPIKNRNGIIRRAPNFPKSSEGNVFVRGTSSTSDIKPLKLNGIQMYYQQIWVKGLYIVKKLNNEPYL